MRMLALTTMLLTLTAAPSLARPPAAELDGRAPFIGPTLTSSQTKTVRLLTAGWRRNETAAHTTLAHLYREERDLVEVDGPIAQADLDAVLEQEQTIDRSLAAERVSNEVVIHNLLSSEQLLDASRTTVVWARPVRWGVVSR